MRYRPARHHLFVDRPRLLKTITKVGGAAVVTGAAGFIGSTLARRLLGDDWTVIGIDSFDDFYHPVLKRSNVAPLEADPRFTLLEVDIRDRPGLLQHLAENVTGDIDVVIHAAALAGVRPSALGPGDYYDVNVSGTAAVLELMRTRSIPHLVFVSSSSIYGVNPDVPWCEDSLPQPISVYAATKLAGERLAACAAVESGFTVASARLFTVYGPGQRPDLAITNFAARMINDMPIQVFGDGSAVRDFTYVDDVVSGLRAAMDYTDHSFQALNLGRGRPVELRQVINTLEQILDIEAKIDYGHPVRGDVHRTWASIDRSRCELGYRPSVALETGLKAAVPWFHRVADLI